MRNLLWQSEAWKEYESLQAEKATLKKVNKLLKDIMRNGYECSYGKVEMLKGDFSGFASVRIDKSHVRLHRWVKYLMHQTVEEMHQSET